METLFDWKKTLLLVRGIPGSGKSTLALKLVNGNRNQVVENDDFWFNPLKEHGEWSKTISGPYQHFQDPYWFEYEYCGPMTHLAANWCAAEAFRRLRVFDTIAVANTFIKRAHVFPWLEQARSFGVNVKLFCPKTDWVNDVKKCLTKNVHGVPEIRIQQMMEQWENIDQEEVDDFLPAKGLTMVVLGLIIGIVIGFVLASLCHAGGDTDEADSNYFDLEEFCNNLNIDEDDIDDIETLGNFDLGELGVEEDD